MLLDMSILVEDELESVGYESASTARMRQHGEHDGIYANMLVILFGDTPKTLPDVRKT